MQSYDAWYHQITLADHSEKVGKFELAEQSLRFALRVADAPDAGPDLKPYTLQRLARCLWALARHAEAELLYLDALEATNDGELSSSISHDLAKLYYAFNRQDETIKYYRHALSIKSKHLGSHDKSVVQLKDEFANVLQIWGYEYLAAELHAESHPPQSIAQEITQSNPAIEEPIELAQEPSKADLLTNRWEEYMNLAEIHHRDGDYSTCNQAWSEALKIADSCGRDSEMYCATLERIATLQNYQGNTKEAERLLLEAYSIKMNVLGPNHPSVAATTQELSIIYFEMQHFERAAYHNLAVLYHSKGDYVKAEPYYVKGLELKRQVFGNSHLETINLMRGYADLLHKTHRVEDAKQMDEYASGILSGAYAAQSELASENHVNATSEYIPV